MNKTALRARLAAEWEKLPLSNDFMFCRVMSNPDICAELIRRLLHIPVERLEEVCAQKDISTAPDAKGVRFDVYVKDSSRVFDIEIQTVRQPDIARRARFYQAAIDYDTITRGEPYSVLKESYILFLCTFDPFKLGKPVYEVRQVFARETEMPYTVYGGYNDGAHKVFYNCTAYDKETDEQAQALLKYLYTGHSGDAYTKRLDELVYEARQNTHWRKEYMTLETVKKEQWESGKKAGITIGRNEGIAIGEKRMEQAARNMLADGFSVEKIARLTGLAERRVQKLASEQ